MSQKESQKEDTEKAVLTPIQNQAIIIASQGEVKSQLQAESQDRVRSQDRSSQASSDPSSVEDSQDSTPQGTVRNCDCCKCCKDFPVQLARKMFYKEHFYQPANEILLAEISEDEHNKKPNE